VCDYDLIKIKYNNDITLVIKSRTNYKKSVLGILCVRVCNMYVLTVYTMRALAAVMRDVLHSRVSSSAKIIIHNIKSL